MKRRTWIIRVGDHWFLRNIRDLYETLASKYTTRGQSRGIQSLFTNNQPSPFWFRDRVDLRGNIPEPSPHYVSYLKDQESRRSFNEPLEDANTELKLYIAGHCTAGSGNLSSLETTRELDLQISAPDMAKHLHGLFTTAHANPTADKPIKISLVACESGRHRLGPNSWDEPFAVQLLEQLHRLGHQHILIKAPTGSVSAPFFGVKSTEGRKKHFYLGEGIIYCTDKSNDLRKMVLKVLKACHTNTHVEAKREYLEGRMNAIGNLGYTTSVDQVAQLKALVREASEAAVVKEFGTGRGAFRRFFNTRSRTETALQELVTTLEARTETYHRYKTCPAAPQ